MITDKTMSASIYWFPIERAKRSLSVSAPSRFCEAMRIAFGEAPWHIGPESVHMLRDMAAMHRNDRNDNPFDRLIEAIEQDGEPQTIEVWAEY